MLKKVIAIIIIVAFFWILQWAGLISPIWMGISGFVFIVFGLLFTIMLGDNIEHMVPVGVMFLIIGAVLILIQPAGLL
jgi:hypothetical protein